MINVFNRVAIYQDRDTENAAIIYTKLRKAGIEYKVVISGKGSSSSMVRFPRGGRTGGFSGSATTAVYGSGGVPDSWVNNHASGNLYTVFVSKKDLTKAKEICELE